MIGTPILYGTVESRFRPRRRQMKPTVIPSVARNLLFLAQAINSTTKRLLFVGCGGDLQDG